MAKRAKVAPPPAREPRLLVRIVGWQFGTLVFIGGLIAVVSAWVIWDKLNQEEVARRVIPLPLYLYLGVGLTICALVGGARYLFADEFETVNRRRRSLKESKLLLKEVRRGIKSHASKISPGGMTQLKEGAAELEAAREQKDWDKLSDALLSLDRKLDEHLAFARKSQLREYTESIAAAVLIALFLRAFVIEAFKIPSGSMIPTLQVGDHIFVNKFIYGIRPPWPWEEMEFGRNHPKFFMGIRKPKRGEVIVFKYPKDPDKDFIKRIIGVEGDTVEIKDNVLYVNGEKVPNRHIDGPCEYEDYEENDIPPHWTHRRCDGFRETWGGHEHTIIFNEHSGGPLPSFPPVTVPPNTVFVMGDNRDNSHDSRYWGTVPFENIKGKAIIIWWSSGEPEGIRVRRFGHLVE